MHSQEIAETTEFRSALVGSAKGKGANGGGVVNVLELGVAPQNIQNGSVDLPQEL